MVGTVLSVTAASLCTGLYVMGTLGAPSATHSPRSSFSFRATADAISGTGTVLSPHIRSVLSGARRLGPLGPSTMLHLSLGLKGRNNAALNTLLDNGKTVPVAEYDDRFGPDPALVAATEKWLRAEGLKATWSPGDATMPAQGTAADIEKAFSVSLSRYRVNAADSRHPIDFYAPTDEPRVPMAERRVVASVVGLDDYPIPAPMPEASSSSCGAVGSPQTDGGFTPDQVAGFYNFGPLYKAGLSGAGQTVVFIEIDGYQQSDLQMYADGFGLPPFNITGPVVNQSWGVSSPLSFSGCGTETELDVEIVHAMAPQAQLVIYDALGSNQSLLISLQHAISTYPHAIVNMSLGGCEDAASAKQFDALFTQLAAGGGTAYVSSGDSGAYVKSCPGHTLTVSEPASAPHATAVGGTTAFVGAGSTYGEEAVWGNPYEQWGSGGGLSSVFKRPSWQTGLGVSNQYSSGMREVPDVASIADIDTGWDTVGGGAWSYTGGTSAAAPLWAALASLTDQALAKRSLGRIGFDNPALYDFGSNPSHFPGLAYHPVTEGNNLYYRATSTGWNYGTGWGTPNAAAVVDDFIAYERGTR